MTEEQIFKVLEEKVKSNPNWLMEITGIIGDATPEEMEQAKAWMASDQEDEDEKPDHLFTTVHASTFEVLVRLMDALYPERGLGD